MSSALNFLSGGAAQGLVAALGPAFEAAHGIRLQGQFGAVGAMKQKLLDGAPSDVLILTQALIDGLTVSGHVRADSARPLGTVMTGLAVQSAQPDPEVHDADSLRQALRQAHGIYFPDPQLATAGIHFMKVLQALGVAEQLADRLRPYPNGAKAMQAMAASEDPKVMGCTQVTEILITPGIKRVADLPAGLELATVYTAAVTTAAAQAELAAQWVAVLSGASAATARHAAGFQPLSA